MIGSRTYGPATRPNDRSILALCFAAFLIGDAAAAWSIPAMRRR